MSIELDFRDFIEEISKQKPEKPDYWSSCGQCDRNIDRAQELLEPARTTHEKRLAEGWVPIDERLPDVGQWVHLLEDRNEDYVWKLFLKCGRWRTRHAVCVWHTEEDGQRYAAFGNHVGGGRGHGVNSSCIKYWKPFPVEPTEDYEDTK